MRRMLGLAVLGLLLACSAPAGQGTPPPAAAQALDFQAQDLQGAPVSGQALAGRDVALWFWAPW